MQDGVTRAHEIPAARTARRRPVATGTSEDRQLHDQASTCSTSGPRNRGPGSPDLAGAPLLDEDYLILSTIHSAKGLEWDVVHVIHASDGNIPSDMATGDDEELEEERRLLYVALTRARNALTVSYPQRYYRRQKPRDDVHMYGLVSRFLDPEEVRVHLDASGPVVDVRDDHLEPVTGSAGVDAYLADLFG